MSLIWDSRHTHELCGGNFTFSCPGKEVLETGLLKVWYLANWHMPLVARMADVACDQACCRSQGQGKLVILRKLDVLVPQKWTHV